MILLVHLLNNTPDAIRYAFMDTGLGHQLYDLLSHLFQVWEDGSITIP